MAINSNTSTSERGKPAFREPWFWMVMGPLIVVLIACAITITIAVRNKDDLVVGDYYKEGRAINERFDARQLAQDLKLKGTAQFLFAAGEVQIQMQAKDAVTQAQLSPRLQLTLSHPASAAKDRVILLNRNGRGDYVGMLPEALEHRWYMILQPVSTNADDGERAQQAAWRLTGRIDFDSQAIGELQAP